MENSNRHSILRKKILESSLSNNKRFKETRRCKVYVHIINKTRRLFLQKRCNGRIKYLNTLDFNHINLHDLCILEKKIIPDFYTFVIFLNH